MTLALVLPGVIVLAAAGLWLHHILEGEWLPADLWREYRLARTPLETLDAAWQADVAGRSDIIVSLTTIPSRMDGLDDTLKSLLDQSRRPARIVLNVPAFSIREKKAYVVPERLRALASLEVRQCDDVGPATKLIPTLLAVSGETRILVVDDDRIYPPWLLARYEEAASAMPDAALTMAGWIVPADLVDRPTTVLSNLLMRPPAAIRAPRLRRAKAVDVMQGVMSYLVQPRFFDPAELADVSNGPDALFYVDDVRTSALCKVDKFVIPAPSLSFIPKRRRGLYAMTALGLINRGKGGNEERHNTIAIRYYADRWRVGGRGR